MYRRIVREGQLEQEVDRAREAVTREAEARVEAAAGCRPQKLGPALVLISN